MRVAIDDFGTGYSSLAYLQKFPVDALKIDRSFIARCAEKREGETLIQTLVQLGKALSIETPPRGSNGPQELSLCSSDGALRQRPGLPLRTPPQRPGRGAPSSASGRRTGASRFATSCPGDDRVPRRWIAGA